MKPYLESVRRLTRIGLVLFALSTVASIVVAMQYCTQTYIGSLPSMRTMFLPLVGYTYIGGVALALDGFSFLNKRSDSDYYHSLPISRRRLFWSISLAGLTWIAATVLASVLLTTAIFTITKVSFVALYPLVAVPFYIVATMLVFAAAAIAASLTGTLLTDLGITVLVLGLFRFIQFVFARGIIAEAQIIGWLDLPWYFSPVSNIATGQLALLMRPMLDANIYHFINIGYSALLAIAELFIACLIFKKRPSELAEHGAKNEKAQTLFACLAVVPVAMLLASGAVVPNRTNILLLLAIAIGIYLIYQIVVLRSMKKVVRTLPWLMIPLALSVAGFFGTRGMTQALQTEIPNQDDIAYVQFGGVYRGTSMMTYQQYLVSEVEFTEESVIDYALSSLQDNISSIQRVGYVYYDYNSQNTYYSTLEPVTFVLKDGRKIGRIVTFENQNQLMSLREQNAEYAAAIRSLPPEDSICYLQGSGVYSEKFDASRDILRAFYEEVPQSGVIISDSYRQYDPTAMYGIDDQQSMGSIDLAGYVGMFRYVDYYNIRLELPKTASAWMAWQNAHSTNEYFDLLQKIADKSDSFTSDSDYLNCSMVFYNMPMSDGTKQSVSFYYNRYFNDDDNYSVMFEPLVSELVDILSRSVPTTDSSAMCVFTTWSGRAIGDDGQYYGADIMALNAASDSNGMVSNGNVFYTSNGVAFYTANNGSIISYNPSYRAFTSADQARVIEILKQWQELQKSWSYTGMQTDDSASIQSSGGIAATPTPEPPSIFDEISPTPTP